MSKSSLYLFLLFFGCLTGLRAQDAQFTQFLAFSPYLNPAFVGGDFNLRVTAIHRNQWAKIPGGYQSSGLAVEHSMRRIAGSFGLMFNDQTTGQDVRTTNISGLFGYKVKAESWNFRFGLQGGYGYRRVGDRDLIFTDQIDEDGNISSDNGEGNEGGFSKGYVDFSAGALAYSKLAWVGVSLFHLGRPNVTLLEGNVKYPRRFSLHGGFRFNLGQFVVNRVKEQVFLMPMIHYQAQGKADQLEVGAYVEIDPILAGIFYRGLPVFKEGSNDAISFLVGYRLDHFTFAYSYDLTISALTPSSGGTHELSINYGLPYSCRRGQRPKMPCPSF